MSNSLESLSLEATLVLAEDNVLTQTQVTAMSENIGGLLVGLRQLTGRSGKAVLSLMDFKSFYYPAHHYLNRNNTFFHTVLFLKI